MYIPEINIFTFERLMPNLWGICFNSTAIFLVSVCTQCKLSQSTYTYYVCAISTNRKYINKHNHNVYSARIGTAVFIISKDLLHSISCLY